MTENLLQQEQTPSVQYSLLILLRVVAWILARRWAKAFETSKERPFFSESSDVLNNHKSIQNMLQMSGTGSQPNVPPKMRDFNVQKLQNKQTKSSSKADLDSKDSRESSRSAAGADNSKTGSSKVNGIKSSMSSLNRSNQQLNQADKDNIKPSIPVPLAQSYHSGSHTKIADQVACSQPGTYGDPPKLPESIAEKLFNIAFAYLQQRSSEQYVERDSFLRLIIEDGTIEQILIRITKYPQSYNSEFIPPSAQILSYISASNFETCQQRILEPLSIQKQPSGLFSTTVELTAVEILKIQMLDHCNINQKRLSKIIQDLTIPIKNAGKRSVIILINTLRNAYWNWIESYPSEFSDLWKTKRNLGGIISRLIY